MSYNFIEQRISEIDKRCEKATPGPWPFVGGMNHSSGDRCAKSHEEVVAEFRRLIETGPVGGAWCVACFNRDNQDESLLVAITGNGPTSHENAKFIANARDDIPWLLSQLREAREQLKDYRTCLEAAAPGIVKMLDVKHGGKS